MIKNYIYLGAPGVGKGTLAQIVAERDGIVHISTGEIFRNEINNQTELGKRVKAILDAGEYVSDDLTNAIVKKTLLSPKVQSNGFILDGYPRTLNQANFLKSQGFEISAAILLDAPEKVIIERLLGRKRADDNPETIKNRLNVYNQKTLPLINFYKNEGKLLKVDASGTIEDNFKVLKEAIK